MARIGVASRLKTFLGVGLDLLNFFLNKNQYMKTKCTCTHFEKDEQSGELRECGVNRVPDYQVKFFGFGVYWKIALNWLGSHLTKTEIDSMKLLINNNVICI